MVYYIYNSTSVSFSINVAVAGEIQCQFYSVSSSDLMSSWVGETEK